MSYGVKKFAAFDIDGTIFRWQLYHELFDAFVDENIVSETGAKKVLEARELWQKRSLSYSAYEMQLMSVMEKTVVGLDDSRVREIARSILTRKGHRTYLYTLDLLHKLQKKGYTIIAISASFQQLVEEFCNLHAIDIALGRVFDVVDGKLSDKSNLVHGNKHTLLKEAVKKYNLSWEESYAVGDSGGDSSMLELVTHPIAFNPNDELLAEAKRQNWPIVVERKSIAYTLEKGNDGSYLLAATDLF